ncbi:MAG TPA: ATP-binding protein [Candidatus Paceibacterota bacterium]|nr:ATP-binding protein [Candidatus Pacearchaeota archaeon]HRZ50643.1 ATP-binding protein [Candidatus Paceibacterota bacterium]HSA36460.1 ATP-binding protein [Candidatus Paceibacterota bacterium]
MIHSFSCKNFYSFKDLATVNFVVNENAPKDNGYFVSSAEERLSKVEVVIGPNASGKTNLLKVLPFLKWLIVDSFKLNPTAPITVKPFLSNVGKDKPIELSVEFEIEGKVYVYSFKLNEKIILSEELKLKSKTKKKTTSKKIFSREWIEADKKYKFIDQKFNAPKGIEDLLRTNASVIESAIRLNHKESQDIARYWQQIATNVIEAGWVGDFVGMPSPMVQLVETSIFFSENEKLKKAAETLLSKFDLGLEAIDIKKEKVEDRLNIEIKGVHSFNGQKQSLLFQYESSGTRQLFVLLKSILQVLDRGGIAILDELDVNLHPEMVSSLLDLFINPDTNPKNSQILFSTHSHQILNRLDKYQIVLVEKNENGSSDSWRLDEMAGVRADDNYFTKYIAGAYGAVPKIK